MTALGRSATVKEQSRRVVHMKICKAGTSGDHMLYSMRVAAKHFPGWDDLLPDVKTMLVEQILTEAASVRAKARAKGSAKAPAASRASRTGIATSRHETMWDKRRCYLN